MSWTPDKSKFTIGQFRDGAVVLHCGDGMEHDLIFSLGCMYNDPQLEEQKAILEYIISAINK
jgi:hypothetical protein